MTQLAIARWVVKRRGISAGGATTHQTTQFPVAGRDASSATRAARRARHPADWLRTCARIRGSGRMSARRAAMRSRRPATWRSICSRIRGSGRDVWQGVLACRQPGEAHAYAYGGEVTCLRHVRQGVLPLQQPGVAHAHAYGGEAACLRHVRQGVLPVRQPGCAHAHAYRG